MAVRKKCVTLRPSEKHKTNDYPQSPDSARRGKCDKGTGKVWECSVRSATKVRGKVKIPTGFDKIASGFIKIASGFVKIPSGLHSFFQVFQNDYPHVPDSVPLHWQTGCHHIADNHFHYYVCSTTHSSSVRLSRSKCRPTFTTRRPSVW